MTSIVIPYQLAENGLELRYALRSAEKHLAGIGDVWLIGDRPDWYTGRHIPFVQRRGNIIWKQRNIYEKVLAACVEPEISDTFLFMNDDHYLLRPYSAEHFPYYCDSNLFHLLESVYGDYKETVINTAHSIGDSSYNFDVHCPILYKKDRFTYISEFSDWSKPNGYCIKSLYCSDNDVEPIQIEDFKIRYEIDYTSLAAGFLDEPPSVPWFSTSDRCFNPDLRRLMNELYPEKSRWEK